MSDEVKYQCKGTCGWTISEKEFNQGHHLCMADGCNYFGKPLVKIKVCEQCHQVYFADEKHEHQI